MKNLLSVQYKKERAWYLDTSLDFMVRKAAFSPL
jgi:hypothetical protein